jgi:hypothetical protein
MSWQERASANNRAYDEYIIKLREQGSKRHREERRSGETVSRTDRRGGRLETREIREALYDRNDPDPGLSTSEKVVGSEGYIVHKARPQSEDEKQAWARLKVWE